MKKLEQLFRKKKKLVVGLMSGTSADGIDAVLVEIKDSGTRTKIQQLAFRTFPYPSGFKQFLLKNSNPSTARLDDIARLDMLIAKMFADAAKKIVRQAGYNLKDIDLIGSHGQTIQHLPVPVPMFGQSVHSSMQIGHPSAIAKYTGIVTVGDFRVADVAVGGSGAPLVPYFDYLLFRSSSRNRALLNIGGIANITILPKRCSLKDVVAFDTGPGNMIVDGLSQKLFKKSFDRNGAIASSGKIDVELMQWMLTFEYFKKPLPKSTGRELFGDEFQKKIISKSKRVNKKDILTTVSEFTALTVYDSYLRYIRKQTHLDELLVSGGGVHNIFIMDALKMYFDPVTVKPLLHDHFTSDAKEAVCFAVLANETISGNPANVPAVTGSSRTTGLGVVCLP